MNYRTRNIVLASGLGLLAVLFVMLYISRVRNDEDVGKRLVSVLIAGRDIPEGTPGTTLQNGAFVKKRVPRKIAAPGWVSVPSQVRGEVVTQDILAGEQVTTRKFSPLANAGVRSRIRGYGRVVQLAGDENQVLDGTLNPGDRVDVIGSWTPASCQSCAVSSVIVRNALVLRTSSELTSSESSNDHVPIQLRLTDEEASAVFLMQKHGAWQLVLRPVVKPRDHVVSYDSFASILRELKRRGLIR
jgi:Flp pilus assembly protein CpaB